MKVKFKVVSIGSYFYFDKVEWVKTSKLFAQKTDGTKIERKFDLDEIVNLVRK